MTTIREGARNALGPLALDGVGMAVRSNGGDWRIAWHSPASAPDGEPHGANALCLSETGDRVVLISNDERRWGWPGGRPERGETWEDVLRREMKEEACCEVTSAELLGFVRAECLGGREKGVVLVRSVWRAVVRVHPWRPEHEIRHRDLVPIADLATRLWMDAGFEPIYARAAHEAGLLPMTSSG